LWPEIRGLLKSAFLGLLSQVLTPRTIQGERAEVNDRKPGVSPDILGYLRGRISEVARAETRATSEPLADWVQRNIRLEGKPFSFEGHAYLRALYDDTAPHVVLSKAAQIGGTVWAILRSLHTCLQGLNVVYLFPTRTDVIEFSKSRVGPLIADNAFLARRVQDTDTAGLKRIGSAHLYHRGTQSAVGLKSVPADMVVFDELDEVTPDAKVRALERLAHSDYKRIIELSNPSLPGYGIDESYEKSDQRHWTLKCPACGEWTALDAAFPTKLGEEVRVLRERGDGSCYRACSRCGAELDLEAGEWVPTIQDRQIHGYRISQLFSSKVDPAEILREYRTTRFPARFYNLKIGIPWTDLENKLDMMTVLSLCGEAMLEEKSERPCTMGVDTGKQLHVVILREDPNDFEKHHVIHLAVCHDFPELDALMERFQVERCVIDGLPETHATREFSRRHSGKVYMNFFNIHQRGAVHWDHQARTVQVNRTESLDASRAAIRHRKVVLPRRVPLVELFANHLTQDARILEEDPDTGAQSYKYIRTGEDHFSLAFSYAWMSASDESGAQGWLRFLRRQIEEQARARHS
jgi:phage terminase large subunit GpA